MGRLKVRYAMLLLVLPASCGPGATVSQDKISYNRDIRPVLSENCFYCHGPDRNKRKGKFRLDIREDAITKKAIVPGKPLESELVKRISTKDLDDLMPPPETHKTLTPAQKELLRRWIASGAKYEPHWSYVPPVKAAVPEKSNPIDFLVRQRLHEVGLKPSPQADRRTLARRLHFDLIGLPPKPEETEAFMRDKSSDAYAQLVEKLLASPHFGERMAMSWLDVVRYADTIGYHSDNPRNVWPYRDYVIRAFNENKPFDQFTREQLAGDLLPKSTPQQKVASAFNRLLLTTEEGGAQPKDYEVRMLTDRVRAVGTVWLGQTIGCSQCHDHKFDPITQRDFYSMGAFFADVKEAAIGHREEGMILPDAAQERELARLKDEAARAQKELDAPHAEFADAFARWENEQTDIVKHDRLWTALLPAKAQSSGGATLETQADLSIRASGKKPETDTYNLSFTNALDAVVGLRIEALPGKSGPGRGKQGNFVLTEVVAKVESTNPSAKSVSFTAARASFEQTTNATNNPYKIWNAASVIDGDVKGDSFGWAILPRTNVAHQLVLQFAAPLSVELGETLTLQLKQNHGVDALASFRIGVSTNSESFAGKLEPPPAKEIGDILLVPADKRDQAQKDNLLAHFKGIAPEWAPLRDRVASTKKARDEFEASLPHCLVSISEEPRTVRILPRGNFQIETGDIVKPALPVYLTAAAGAQADQRLTRLDLANWLLARDNPLTARVVMNRLWKQFFGIGLSKVADDLGSQGELPPNQPLLDWLACEFVDSGWDLKHMIRLIVNSETYKQTSSPTKRIRTLDPLNREFAAQGRWRLEAEFVRDNALGISGLLVNKVGGPSVKPYQPDGYWENLNFPVRSYDESKGEDQHRRGLYTWWQRTFLHPSMLAFDAPSREECAADRNRSNIPQQALVLLNDPTYVEASRAFAARILKEGGANSTARIEWAWRQALCRPPRPDERKTIQALLDKEVAEYRSDKDAAAALLKIGQTPPPSDLDPAELAAWTNIARVILNLHETITRS